MESLGCPWFYPDTKCFISGLWLRHKIIDKGNSSPHKVIVETGLQPVSTSLKFFSFAFFASLRWEELLENPPRSRR